MHAAYPLDNPIMAYEWGSRTALAELLGQPQPSAEPQAELWMGAHPKAPSQLAGVAPPRSLADLIADEGPAVLGTSVAAAFGGRLPYLLKVLAAQAPLSIQAHPSLDQAREGFVRENRSGIPLAAPHRNYRDDNHKPELICALTPFWALCGFRPPEQIARLLNKACPDTLGTLAEQLATPGDKPPLARFLEGLLGLETVERHLVLEEAIGFCLATREDAAHWRWIPRLAQAYPGDIGALAPIFLNLVCLQPGEALFLPARELHAYLEGTGIEIMANSDNVLRGGLTPKHVDLPELLGVLNFAPFPLEVLHPQQQRPGLAAYPAFCAEFQLHQLLPGQAGGRIELATAGPEILLCTAGELAFEADTPASTLRLERGGALFVPATTGTYRLSGEGCAYRAMVPAEAV